jgi:signal transduction histidine kinase
VYGARVCGIAARAPSIDDGAMVGDPVNLSREFRTLVTSIRGPLEDEIADGAGLPPARRERLRGLHRNVMRLFQLVNTLFDLSESGGRLGGDLRAGPERVDLSAQTVVIPRLRDGNALQPSGLNGHHNGHDLDVSACDLERANQELEAFSYSVSHDLRAPLRAVDAFSQVLLGDHAQALGRDGRELVEQIHVNTQRMTAIVDDLLALSQAGRGELRRDGVDLTVMARRIVANLRLREPTRVVEVSVADGLAATGDARLITLALENLFANAWKFTGKRTHPQVIFEREDGGVFALRDNGAGFDMSYSERLFEPFQRLHSSSDFEGTGIGLAIVRRVIERHGGRVWAQAAVDRGAIMRFTLEPDPG